MRCEDVYDPVRRERSNAKDDEVREHVVSLRSDLLAPVVKASFPLRERQQSGPERGRDEIA